MFRSLRMSLLVIYDAITATVMFFQIGRAVLGNFFMGKKDGELSVARFG